MALEDLASEWSSKVTECAKQYGDKKAKLWSFEVKRLINISNVRSTFFQAVSNSSWANFGYLVAAELEEKAKKELRNIDLKDQIEALIKNGVVENGGFPFIGISNDIYE